MFYKPEEGHGLPHDPFKAIVAPRPIGWISSLSETGVPNLAPYSFFNAISSHPHLVIFSSEGHKDSVSNIEKTGEFVTNLVSRDLAEVMNRTSVNAPAGVSEFDYAGIEREASHLVAPPRVKGVLAALECVVTDVQRPKGRDGESAGVHLVIGEVVGVYLADNALTDGLFDIVSAGSVARLGYMDYSSVTETFQMRRPKWGDQ
jgi:flavin reductase (DIM6/NTAB) family NADH-FMN oxidoreductase RutF